MRNLTYVTDMRHFLTADGEIPDLPNAAMNLTLFLGSIVAWMTTVTQAPPQLTNVPCRKSPGRKRCLGEIMASFVDEGDVIRWSCPFCGDNGFIHHWQGTPWDRTFDDDSAGAEGEDSPTTH
jgi:hypothetical protein